MSSARSPRAAMVALLVGFVAAAAGVGASLSIAEAASPHRAAVIVDTGGTVHKVVITFSEDSISGIEALQRAGGEPVVYSMGPGGAVCRIFGVGRDAGPNCLGGADGDARYWAYFRAPAGTSSFTYSSVGAGTARVHDGDVEGWKFGTGSAPAFVSLASLTPPPPPPSTTPTTKPAATVTPGGSTPGAAVGPAATGATSTSTLPLTGGAATANGAAGSTGSTGGSDASSRAKRSDASEVGASGADGKTVETALTSSEQDSGDGSTWSLLLFAVLILAIVGAIFLVRRMRKQPVHP